MLAIHTIKLAIALLTVSTEKSKKKQQQRVDGHLVSKYSLFKTKLRYTKGARDNFATVITLHNLLGGQRTPSFRVITLAHFTTFMLANFSNKKETSPLVLEGHLRFLSWIYSCLLESTDFCLKTPMSSHFPQRPFPIPTLPYISKFTHTKILTTSSLYLQYPSFFGLFFPNTILPWSSDCNTVIRKGKQTVL